MKNLGEGLGHGALGLVGLGQIYNPLGDAQAALSKAQSANEACFQSGTMAWIEQQAAFNGELDTLIKQNARISQLQSTLSNNYMNNRITTTNTFLVGIMILVLIMVPFLLAAKQCKK